MKLTFTDTDIDNLLIDKQFGLSAFFLAKNAGMFGMVPYVLLNTIDFSTRTSLGVWDTL